MVNIISKHTTSEVSIFWLVSVADQAGLGATWSETPEDRFSSDGAHLVLAHSCRLSDVGGNYPLDSIRPLTYIPV